MAQPETAVGGSDEPIIAAEPTIEDRFAAIKPEEEEGDAPEAKADDAPPELTPEDVPDEDEADAEAPPIAPPVSWTAEEKAEFAELPRDLQETLTRRESEREKFVQSKAQEAKQAETRAQSAASEVFQNIGSTFTQQLASLRVQLPDRPSHQMQAEDPFTYAEQMDSYEQALAHNQWIERQVGQVTHQLRQAQAGDFQRSQQETLAVLQTDFPEWLDPAKGPELQQRLGSTAQALGYSAEQILSADHDDIKAMRLATDWRLKADKYDKLMANKMEKVRDARGLPKVSRPGTAQGPGAAANQRYTADRTAMKGGDRDAASRVFSRFL